MMKKTIIISGLFSALLLLLILKVHEMRLASAIKKIVANDVKNLIANRPVVHNHTLFSEIFIDNIESTSKFSLGNKSTNTSDYVLATMSPCNPRIRICR